MFYDEEINKMDMEYRTSELKAQKYITSFVDEIKKINKNELYKTVSTPLRLKVPFKVKLKRFFEKLNKSLG